MTTPLLDVTDLSKGFGGVTALSEVTLNVASGEAVGLVGPNGAGKTTFFDCVLGMTPPDSGQVEFDGHDITHLPLYKRARLGIGRTFQRMELFTSMTVREHLMVAARAASGTGRLWKDLLNLGRPSTGELHEVNNTLELLGIADIANAPADTLSMGRGRLVEMGRALMMKPRLLMLDEPSAGLDSDETDALVHTIRSVCDKTSMAVLLVEHDLVMVSALAERLYVLDFGTLIGQGPTAATLADPLVRKAYLGEPAAGG